MYFPKDEYEDRWARLDRALRDKGYDAAVVWSRSGGTYDRCGDVLYLSNSVSTESGQEPDNKLRRASAFAAVILTAGEPPLLVADEPPPGAAIATDRWTWSYDTVGAVAEHLRQLGDRKVALAGSDVLPMKYAGALTEACPQLAVDDMLVHRVRMHKSPRELAALRQGGAIASEALTRVMEALLAGKTEAEAAALGAVEAISDAIKPGVSVLEMARLGERLTEEAGGGRDQAAVKWPIYGHGLGLFWEKPDISTSYAEFDMAFEPNMAFGIEAFLAHDGVGSAGFEQNIIVNETGTELLTATPMLWWE